MSQYASLISSLCPQSGLSKEERIDQFWELRGAFEDAYPDRMTDASDAYVLTVFPFGDIDNAPDDYEVEDWAVGWFMVNGSWLTVHG